MTKTLTEQWRDGELDKGWYYVVREWDDEIRRLYFEGDYFLETDVPLDNDNIKEVLAPVPSYEEVKQFADASKKVKELEKRLEVSEKEHYRTLEQLRIATKALKDMPEMSRAQRALREIGGVK